MVSLTKSPDDGNGASVPAGRHINQMMAGFARMAARISGAATVLITVGDSPVERSFSFGSERPGSGNAAYGAWPTTSRALVDAAGASFGLLALSGPSVGTLDQEQAAALDDVSGLIAAACIQDMAHASLLDVTNRAIRLDRMLQTVSESESCATALTGLLEELCRFHGALIGRIWNLNEEGLMQEVSRFHADPASAHEYYRKPPAAAVRLGNSMTADAIRLNEPQTVIYSQVHDPGRYVLMKGAIASGLASQVSFPIWVQDQRFGVSLAFPTERADLGAIVDDIASLANTIRPALFRKVTEERIRHMAHHDHLTQLGNRVVFHQRMDDALASEESKHGLALLYLDLDGFKRVNDARGHEVGDKLLSAVAGRLRAGVRDVDMVARIGGDEFAVIQPAPRQPYAATQLARRLLQTIAEPFEIDGQLSMVGVSIGIALYPTDGDTADLLLRHADAALYDAKSRGRNRYRLFEPSLGALQQDRMLIERDLKEAISRQQFSLVYQPICDTTTLEVRGLEALLRWEHPARGTLAPARFVPLAESSGLIVPLGHWALEAACLQAASWNQPLRLAVNFSALQFRQPGLPELIAGVLKRTGLAAERLDLEITEGLLLEDSAVVLQTMHALKELGLQLTLDDFGTAFASLSTLRRFPFDRIKIDMSFIQGMCDDDGTLAIVQAVLSLTGRLKLSVVAEGVETERELCVLRALGCELVQGYLIGRPMPSTSVQGFLDGAGSPGVVEGF